MQAIAAKAAEMFISVRGTKNWMKSAITTQNQLKQRKTLLEPIEIKPRGHACIAPCIPT